MTKIPSSLREAAGLIERREVSPVELTRACLDRIAAGNADLHAFITVMEERALAVAARAERSIAAGKYRGPLHGIPVSVKDLVDVAGTPTTSGSRVPPRQPGHDAPVVANLLRAGAVIIGKTNLHEFAFGTTSDETAFGAVRNPLDRTRSAGGSSGGAAVALLEGMCYGSVGTDTGGSIRIPAAACGITGLKPTLGEISTDSVVPLSSTLDHVGPLARTVEDTALMFHAMLDGEPRLDRLSAEAVGPLWLGVPVPYFFDKLDDDVVRLFGEARAALRRAVDRALEGLDALLLPALPIGAPELGAASVTIGATQEPVRATMLRLTQLFNVTGHPAIALPCGVGRDGLPRALQLVGHRGSTDRLLAVAAAVERQIIGGAGSVGGGPG